MESTAPQSIESFKNALSYAKKVCLSCQQAPRDSGKWLTPFSVIHKALELAPDQVIYQFNVAFVQFQLAQTIRPLPENQRTLADMEAAAIGLDEAIK